MKTVIIPALGFLLFFAESIACAQGDKALPAIALVGGTLIDVSNSGHSTRDIPNAVVVLRAGKIEGAGPAALVKVPRDARTIDCRGAYILPGLVDGFAGLNSQPQANAWLYMGVTTIVGSQDDRCGRLKRDAHPSPHVYPIDLVGSIDVDSFLVSIPHWRNKLKSNDDVVELNEQESKAQLEDLWRQGVRAAYLGRDLTADRTKFIISECRRLGLVTYGEFASTPYADALDDGVDVLLHMTRYALGLIPHRLQQPLVQIPRVVRTMQHTPIFCNSILLILPSRCSESRSRPLARPLCRHSVLAIFYYPITGIYGKNRPLRFSTQRVCISHLIPSREKQAKSSATQSRGRHNFGQSIVLCKPRIQFIWREWG